MGLLAVMLGQRRSAPGHEAAHASANDRDMLARLVRDRLAQFGPAGEDVGGGVPGPPPPTLWDSSSAPLPEFSLVGAGMQPITGGRRRSF